MAAPHQLQRNPGFIAMSSIGFANKLDIDIWIDRVRNTPQEMYVLRSSTTYTSADTLSTSVPAVHPHPNEDKENRRPLKKRRTMEGDGACDEEETPRPCKRRRDLDHTPVLPAPVSPAAKSDSITATSSGFESHNSGRLSPVKQLQILEDLDEQPVVFCNFDDDDDIVDGEEFEGFLHMRRAMQKFADGIGILGYDEGDDALTGAHDRLTPLDKTRFQYPWSNEPQYRGVYGSMPSIYKVADIVETSRKKDRGGGASEDDWNTEVHLQLLKLALQTSRYKNNLGIHNV
ncbi:MAG: hypothetical protein LQ342_008023 [Letrouitia transgressa]|nr:MAG: hypothetical protein LQ342_008023 [Letrouitia transgressa]